MIWPDVTEDGLRERQAMDDGAFWRYFDGLLAAIGSRSVPDGHFERAVGYPWDRPGWSSLVTRDGVESLADALQARRREILEQYVPGRMPMLAYGANAAPERLASKFDDLADPHRDLLSVGGHVADVDVGAASQPPLFSSMPATLIPSAGTRVRVAVLFVTPTQFTRLWWTELTYRLGALTDVRFEADIPGVEVDHVLAFVSRYGAFCLDDQAVAMSAIEARGRVSPALSQRELLDAVAVLTLGRNARARDLVRAAYEHPAEFLAEHRQTLRRASAPFAAPGWQLMPV